MSEILAIGGWKTNAELIADAVVPLGYLHVDWPTLDPTYGEGKWWTQWMPKKLIGSDIDIDKSPVGASVDFTDMPWQDKSFMAVAYDPPYKLNGTPTNEKDAPYGVHVVRTRDQRLSLITDGMTECCRVLADEGFLLVKVQDQVNGGKVHWQSDMCSEHAKRLGLRKVDAFFFGSHRPQPAGRRQLTARRNYSTLLVFQKGK